MFKRVDEEDADFVEGFSYMNKSGQFDEVGFGDCHRDAVCIKSSDVDKVQEVCIWDSDIPNLIKALQAAYDYKRSEKDGYK